MATGDRTDPFGAYNFKVELGGIIQGGFKTCSGLDTTRNTIKYREGTDASLVSRQLAGMINVSNITLTHGITTESGLWDWYDRVANGTMDRRDITISLNDDKNPAQPRISWKIKKAWPTKWTGPSFDATNDATGIETLELAHEGVEKVSWQ